MPLKHASQIYWPKPQDEDVTLSLLQRAKAAGCTVLVVTADTFNIGWRPADLDESFLPFLYGQGCQIGLSDPVFNAKYARAQEVARRRPLWTPATGIAVAMAPPSADVLLA